MNTSTFILSIEADNDRALTKLEDQILELVQTYAGVHVDICPRPLSMETVARLCNPPHYGSK